MSPLAASLLPYAPTVDHLCHHHCCCCCYCCPDPAVHACPVYITLKFTCSCAAAVTPPPGISLYWNPPPPPLRSCCAIFFPASQTPDRDNIFPLFSCRNRCESASWPTSTKLDDEQGTETGHRRSAKQGENYRWHEAAIPLGGHRTESVLAYSDKRGLPEL